MDKILIQDLADGLAKRKHISKADAEIFVRNAFEIIKEHLLTEQNVKVKGLGTFKLITVDSRESVNVNTGERITINSHAKVTFTPDTTLRDRVNKPFADFETVVLNDETKTEDMERIDPVVSEETPADLNVNEPKPEAGNPEAQVPRPAQPEEPTPAPVIETPVAEEPVQEEPKIAAFSEPVTKEPEPAPLPAAEAVEEPAREQDEPVQKEDEPERKRSLAWLWGLLALLAVALLCLLFFANKKGETEVEQPVVEEIVEPQDTIAEPAAPAKPMKSPEELAADYAQIEGGEYWIVGTKTTYVLQRGDDLSKLAFEHYGDKHLINYIIKHNGYTASQASNLYVGTEVKLPDLVKKN